MPHIHEKIDFTVEVFIVYRDKVLLRMHDKYKIWLSVGGHIELHEDPIQAALREVKEEVGLDVKIIGEALSFKEDEYTYIPAPRFLGRHKVSDTHEHIVFVYFATAESDAVAPSSNYHERAETRWVSLKELETMDLRPNVRHLAAEALKELGTE
ncbi:MAG TPA: NUDIX domain-containing protein [Candidatus Paceibacterota bacterium]|jgi:8-oxo-dGTP pyrophosphatase MutT (NUDIX family)|nr:NUDIX domain-containing protein [Candidatus Paceibacterota bacterium]